MHLKSRSGGGRQDVGSSNLNALLEEGQPFWSSVVLGRGSEEVRDERNSVIILVTTSVRVSLIEDSADRAAVNAGFRDGAL